MNLLILRMTNYNHPQDDLEPDRLPLTPAEQIERDRLSPPNQFHPVAASASPAPFSSPVASSSPASGASPSPDPSGSVSPATPTSGTN
jgi:hypothetical protein